MPVSETTGEESRRENSRNIRQLLCCACLSPLMISPDLIMARSTDSGYLPSVRFDAGVGLMTYKSLAVASNDTSVTTGYRISAYAGTNKNIGFFIRQENNTTGFAYADSDLTSTVVTGFQDSALLYRWRFLSLGPVFVQRSMVITKRGEDYLDHLGTGIGGHVSLLFHINRDSRVFAEYTQASISSLKEVVQDSNVTTVTAGPRSDLFIGGMIQLTRSLLDLRIGYRQRTWSLSVDGESFNEVQTATWLGFGLRGFF
ncbi:MAG: hypothetical protein H6618_07980 [Deltaproteobacteria bacterium]|nr:hypothetical protein [Deltaproteobacteria bacterium]